MRPMSFQRHATPWSGPLRCHQPLWIPRSPPYIQSPHIPQKEPHNTKTQNLPCSMVWVQCQPHTQHRRLCTGDAGDGHCNGASREPQTGSSRHIGGAWKNTGRVNVNMHQTSCLSNALHWALSPKAPPLSSTLPPVIPVTHQHHRMACTGEFGSAKQQTRGAICSTQVNHWCAREPDGQGVPVIEQTRGASSGTQTDHAGSATPKQTTGVQQHQIDKGCPPWNRQEAPAVAPQQTDGASSGAQIEQGCRH